MDPFQCAASAVALAELSMKLYHTLSKFINEARDADEKASELRKTIRRSLATLLSVKETLEARGKECDQGTPGPEEQRILKNIRESLLGWFLNLVKFTKRLGNIAEDQHEKTTMGWLEKALLQLKLDRKAPAIERIRENISEHVQELSLSLQCLNLFRQNDRDRLIEELYAQLKEITRSNSNAFNMVFPPASNLDGGPARHRSRHERTMHKCIHTAYAVAEKMSEAGSTGQSPGSVAGDEKLWIDIDVEVPDDDSDLDISPKANVMRADNLLVKDEEISPTIEYIEATDEKVKEISPDLNISTPQDILNALIDNYERHAQMATGTWQYDRTEEYQRRMIEHAEEWNSLYQPPRNIGSMKQQLARTLKNQGTQQKLNESKKILEDALSSHNTIPKSPRLPRLPAEPLDAAEAEGKALLYFELAEVNFMRHQQHRESKALQESAIYAKLSVKLRRPFQQDPQSGFQKSVELFVQILEHQSLRVEADTYRTLFLPPMPSTPPASTHGEIQPTPPRHRSTNLMVDPDGCDFHGCPKLVSAIQANDIDHIDDLLASNANAEIIYDNKTALMYAVDSGYAPVITKLQNGGAAIDRDPSPDATGYTALHYAITELSPSMVDALCSRGASTELRYQGHTPLQRAAVLRSADIITVLLRHNAAINATDADGLTALHHALRHDGSGVAAARLLLNAGADPNVQCTGDGRTALHFAVVDRNKTAATVLLELVPTVELEIEDKRGKTPATLAAQLGQYEVLESLLKEGAFIRWDKLSGGGKPLGMNAEKLLKKTEKERREKEGLARIGSQGSSVVDSVVSTGGRRESLLPWRRKSSWSSTGGR
ncbi:MAG: hypothetical protein M1821_003085 [Bathelium mastoideum]|nr:MAG: hypothetical protein M1821_003085 [Bathelium mastoideum]